MIDIIIRISAMVSAITIIAVFFSKIYKMVRKMETNFEKIGVDLASNTMATLRLVIMSDDIPLDERVNAGKEYCDRGGNGSVHAKYEVLEEEYKNQLKKRGDGK